jgi:hypothetical protein
MKMIKCIKHYFKKIQNMKGSSMIVWTKCGNTDYHEYCTCQLQGKYAEDAGQSKDGKVISKKQRWSRNRLTRP